MKKFKLFWLLINESQFSDIADRISKWYFMSYPTNNKEPLSKRGLEILWTFHEFRPLSNPAPPVSPVAKVAQVRQQTLLRSCKTAAILQLYVYLCITNHIYLRVTSIYCRTAWNYLNDHSQNNALALVSHTDLRLKYQQLLFGLTTFCLLKELHWVQSWRYQGTQVPEYPGAQVTR